MNSLYECEVSHCRLRPKRHAFNYRVFMFSVDVDELPGLDRRLVGFRHNRFAIFSIDDRDHVDLGIPGGIRPNLTEWLARQDIDCPRAAKIRLVTFPRVLGYGFNPVSFYYVHDESGEPVVVVAEVVNTFREMKLYAIRGRGAGNLWHQRMAKDFYVSPFSNPGDEFDFTLGLPEMKWRVNIDDYQGDERVLVSAVRGERRTLTSARLLWYAFKYPMLSVKIIGFIHWHAFLLWMRKVPFFRKTENRNFQRDVLRPHASLKKNNP